MGPNTFSTRDDGGSGSYAFHCRIDSASPPSKLLNPPGQSDLGVIGLELVKMCWAVTHPLHDDIKCPITGSAVLDERNNLLKLSRAHERFVSMTGVGGHDTVKPCRPLKRALVGPAPSHPDRRMRSLSRSRQQIDLVDREHLPFKSNDVGRPQCPD